MSIVAVDYAALPALITQVIGKPADYTNATAALPPAASVRVLNGSSITGTATVNTTRLLHFGFRTETPDSTATTDTTTVD